MIPPKRAAMRGLGFIPPGRERYAAAHAPKGGVQIQGTFFKGGEFIPGKVMAKANAAERAAVKGAPVRHRIEAKAGREARAELPVRADRADAQAGAESAAVDIAHPKDDADVPRFVAEVEQTPAYQWVVAKMKAVAADSPGGDPTLWSVGKHTLPGADIPAIVKKHKEKAYSYIPWTRERQVLHKAILRDLLNPAAKAKPGQKPKVVLLTGPPGSGKTTAGQPIADKMGIDFTTINADDIKARLPEYQGWNAGSVHEESSLLAEGPLQQRAMNERHNILFDLTGGNTGKMLEIAKELKEAGYEIHSIHIAFPAYKSAGRAWDRFVKNAFGHADPTGREMEPGRFVPPGYVHGKIDGNPDKTYQALKDSGLVDCWQAVSSDVPLGSKPEPVDKGGAGECP